MFTSTLSVFVSSVSAFLSLSLPHTLSLSTFFLRPSISNCLSFPFVSVNLYSVFISSVYAYLSLSLFLLPSLFRRIFCGLVLLEQKSVLLLSDDLSHPPHSRLLIFPVGPGFDRAAAEPPKPKTQSGFHLPVQVSML